MCLEGEREKECLDCRSLLNAGELTPRIKRLLLIAFKLFYFLKDRHSNKRMLSKGTTEICAVLCAIKDVSRYYIKLYHRP